MIRPAMAEWFYGKDNTQHGPVSEQEIQSLMASGTIDTSTIIWREGMGDWIPLKDVPEFQGLSNTAPAPGGTSSNQTPYTSPQTNAGRPQHVQYAQAPPTDGLAIAALVLGIIAVIFCYIWALFGIPAVICGHISLKKIKNSHTPLGGKGMAIAGLVTGYIGITLQILAIIGFVAAFASASAAPGGYTP